MADDRLPVPAPSRLDQIIDPATFDPIGNWVELYERDVRLPAQRRARSMVIIQVNRSPDVELTLDWFLDVLPEAPAQQLRDAVLVLATDPDAKMSKVLKNETQPGEYLEMHTSVIG